MSQATKRAICLDRNIRYTYSINCMKKVSRLILVILTVLVFSCGGKKEAGDVRFEAETLRGNTVEFTATESGMISISEKNMDKMSAMDRNGMPVYSTSDIADKFVSGKDIGMRNRTGLCVRFRVPKIADNDYLILKAVTRLPKEVKLNGEKTSTLDASYRYDARYSGKMEYIWFLFDEGYPELMIPGKWELELFSNESSVYRTEFLVR